MQDTGRFGRTLSSGEALTVPLRAAVLPVFFALASVAFANDRPVPVMNDIGQPVEGAILSEAQGTSAPAPRGKSDSEGVLRVPRTPLPASIFRLEHPGNVALVVSGAELSRKEELILVRCATLSGTVRDGAPGSPVKDAQVEIFRRGDDRKLADAALDARGRFVARELEPGSVVIRARAPGSLVSVVEASLAPGSTGAVEIPIARPVQLRVIADGVAPETKLTGVRAELRKGPGFPPGVEFMFPGEASATGAKSQVVLPQTRAALKEGPDLSFSAPSGVPLDLRFRADGYCPAGRTLVAKIGSESVRIPLSKGAGVAGQFVDEEARAIAGVSVQARYLDPALDELVDWGAAKPASSTDDGNFRIGALPPGALQLELADSDWVLPRLPAIRLEAAEDDAGKIVLRAGGAILGRVVRKSTDSPVAGAKIRGCLQDLGCAWTIGTRSDKNGSFRLMGISAGTWNLEASHTDFPTARMEGLIPGSGAVLLKLPDGGRLRGRVLGPDGSPLRRVRVQVFAPDAARRIELDRNVDTEDGRFDIAAAPPGRWTLMLQAPGYGPLRLESVEVHDGEPTDLGDIAFFAGRVARGRIVRGDDAPVPGAGLAVRGEVFDEASAAVSDSDGHFELAGLPDAAFALMVQAAGYAPAVVAYASAESADGLELPERTIKLTEGGTVEGTVRGENDEAVGGAELRLPGLGEVSPAVTDLQGRYRLEHVPAGDVAVQLIADPAAPEGWTETRRVAVPNAGTARLDFTASGSVDGLVRRRGQPVPFARISAVAAGGVPLVHTTESDADGIFRLRGLSDGTWTIHVASADCQARFALVNDPQKQDRRLELDLPPEDLSGWVLDDSNSEPLTSAAVGWSDPAAPPDVVTYRMPIPSAAGGVVVLEDRPVAGASARSLSDGSFRLCVPGAGGIEVEASAGRTYEDAYATVVLPPREPVTLKLRPKGDEVRVVVLRADGARASADASIALAHKGGFYEVVPAGAGGEARFTRPKSEFRVWAGIPGLGLGVSEWVPEEAELTEPIQVVVSAGGYLAIRGLEALRERATAVGLDIEMRLIGSERDDLYVWADALGVLAIKRVSPGEETLGPFPMGRYVLQAFIGADPAASKEVEISGQPAAVDLSPNLE